MENSMDGIKDFPQFVRKLFYEHDIAKLNLGINLTQTNIMMMIDETEGKSMSELSRLVGLEKSSFTRSIDYLADHGFIEKESSTEDRRKIYITLTQKGKAAVKGIKEDWNLHFAALLSVLSTEEKTEFSQAIHVVSKYINRIIQGEKNEQGNHW